MIVTERASPADAQHQILIAAHNHEKERRIASSLLFIEYTTSIADITALRRYTRINRLQNMGYRETRAKWSFIIREGLCIRYILSERISFTQSASFLSVISYIKIVGI